MMKKILIIPIILISGFLKGQVIDLDRPENTTTQSREIDASDTIDLSDNNLWLYTNIGSANNLTIPANSIKAFKIGTVITVEQIGAGQTTIVAGAGVTLVSYNSALKLSGVGAAITIRKRAINTWDIVGNLTN
jgi:hypothetical protein